MANLIVSMNVLIAVAYFFTTFFALACLLRWTYLRQVGKRRMRRVLRTYVAVAASCAETEETYADAA